jgi:predicted outer membrane protein
MILRTVVSLAALLALACGTGAECTRNAPTRQTQALTDVSSSGHVEGAICAECHQTVGY